MKLDPFSGGRSWYDWDTSSGDWNATDKTKAWSFATGGLKEVWAEVRDSNENTDRAWNNIRASANAQPSTLPHAFYGTLLINGSDAAIGTVVEATGTGVVSGLDNPITTIEVGKYGGPGGLDPKLVVHQGTIADGAEIEFYVNGYKAVTDPSPVEWHSGDISEVDLTASMPIVVTDPATGITSTRAVLNGSLIELGVASSCEVSFELGTSPEVYTIEIASQEMTSPGTFSAEIDGLSPDTTHYFRAKASGSIIVYGDELNFTTSPSWMYLELNAGWNTFSVPLSLDTDSNTLEDLITLTGLNPNTDVRIAYYYFNNGVTQGYSISTKTYVMGPCDAIIIEMNTASTVPIYPNALPTTSTKDVYVGWNLVGSAFLNETGEMPVDEALISLYYAAGELMPWGYNQVISPAYNQPDWVYTRREFPTTGEVPNMLVGKGYLVSMDNNDEYDGQTYTPWFGPWPEP